MKKTLPQEIIDKIVSDTGYDEYMLVKDIAQNDKDLLWVYLRYAESIDTTVVKSLLQNGLHTDNLYHEFR